MAQGHTKQKKHLSTSGGFFLKWNPGLSRFLFVLQGTFTSFYTEKKKTVRHRVWEGTAFVWTEIYHWDGLSDETSEILTATSTWSLRSLTCCIQKHKAVKKKEKRNHWWRHGKNTDTTDSNPPVKILQVLLRLGQSSASVASYHTEMFPLTGK